MRSLAAWMMAASVLGGCATTRSAPPPVTAPLPAREHAWNLHHNDISNIDRFLLSGRVASSELNLRADLRWLQSADGRFELRMSGPFGAGAVELRGDPSLVEVRNGEGSQFTSDPEGWIRARYGWTLPIGGLRHWVLGTPIPGSPSQEQIDEQGRLSGLVQNGWSLTYTEYRRQGTHDLPRRFEADNGNIKLKLIVDRWDDLPEN